MGRKVRGHQRRSLAHILRMRKHVCGTDCAYSVVEFFYVLTLACTLYRLLSGKARATTTCTAAHDRPATCTWMLRSMS